MVSKVVFPVAGMGTRLLPFTKEVAKELLPIIDTPIIHYAVEEAVAAGLDQMVFITCRGKEALERYFFPNPDLDSFLAEKGKEHLLDPLRPLMEKPPVFIRQEEALGFGHAVALAEPAIGGEPFAIILPDDLIVAPVPVMRQMLLVYERHRLPMIAFMKVPEAEVSRYGIAAGRLIEERLFEIETLVEKPARGQAPSNYAVIGRYIMPPQIFDLLRAAPRGAGAEVQLTDAVIELMKTQKVLGFFFEGERFDLGTAAGYVEATIRLALKRPDTRAAVMAAISASEGV